MNPLIFSYPKGRHHDVVGYIRVVKIINGNEVVELDPKRFSDGGFPERGQGWG